MGHPTAASYAAPFIWLLQCSAEISFGEPGTLANDVASALGVADLDGDGDLDVLVGITPFLTDGHFIVSFNNGDIFDSETFSLVPQDMDVGLLKSFDVADFATGDFDGDGDTDVVVANGSSANTLVSLAMMWNNGGNNFALEILVSNEYDSIENILCNGVRAADFDNDGDLDLVAVLSDGPFSSLGTLVFMENSGTGNFTTTTIANDFNGLAALEVGDMDGDGDVDIVVLAFARNLVWIYENLHVQDSGSSTGSFPTTQSAASMFRSHLVDATAPDARKLALSDLSGNGLLDIIIGYKTINMYTNHGGMAFSTELQLWDIDGEEAFVCFLGCTVNTLHTMDVDGDGRVDILFSMRGTNSINALFQVNSGQFQNLMTAVIGNVSGPTSFLTADLNQDGLVDILVGSSIDRKTYYYLSGKPSEPSSTTSPPTSLPATPPGSAPTPTNSGGLATSSSFRASSTSLLTLFVVVVVVWWR